MLSLRLREVALDVSILVENVGSLLEGVTADIDDVIDGLEEFEGFLSPEPLLSLLMDDFNIGAVDEYSEPDLFREFVDEPSPPPRIVFGAELTLEFRACVDDVGPTLGEGGGILVDLSLFVEPVKVLYSNGRSFFFSLDMVAVSAVGAVSSSLLAELALAPTPFPSSFELRLYGPPEEESDLFPLDPAVGIRVVGVVAMDREGDFAVDLRELVGI